MARRGSTRSGANPAFTQEGAAGQADDKRLVDIAPTLSLGWRVDCSGCCGRGTGRSRGSRRVGTCCHHRLVLLTTCVLSPSHEYAALLVLVLVLSQRQAMRARNVGSVGSVLG